MKNLFIIFLPLLTFAQDNFDKNNKLSFSFNQTNKYLSHTYKQDLSIKMSNELIKNNLFNQTNSIRFFTPLENQDDKILYEYDDKKSVSENLALEIIHTIFFSKKKHF
ncbi:hypothetical protein [Chishuiella sp.]|uniref:hypothetical protein n=1 Tax=Chishuiella sp. TaxID=1969467 RepID=UPI0028AA317A|nr:hypothetical protein [Chishuiella sp.]